jgi:coproporphyrinogen III oxidase-like Fe-S oxidoreductase
MSVTVGWTLPPLPKACAVNWTGSRPMRPGRTVTSVFFGGGTPSLMPPAVVATVIDHIAQRWPVADDVEITLEANPTSIEADNFRGYRTAGVNRVSVGVQALNDNDLKVAWPPAYGG